MTEQTLAWIGAALAVGGAFLAFLRAWHKRERQLEDFSDHISESEPLISRFLALEAEARLFARRLEELKQEVREARDDAKEERNVILAAITELRNATEAKLERLRTAVYEGERRQAPR